MRSHAAYSRVSTESTYSPVNLISIKLCLGPGIIPIRLLLGLGFSTANLVYLWYSLSILCQAPLYRCKSKAFFFY